MPRVCDIVAHQSICAGCMDMKKSCSLTPALSPARFFEPRGFIFCAGLVFALALLIRGIYLAQIHQANFFTLKLVDAASYDSWAREIASGNWLGDKVFYQAPLYPYLLGIVYALLGDSVLLVRTLQSLLGSVSCVLLAGAGWQIFSPAVGVTSGLLAALYAPAIFYDSLIQKSVLDFFLLSLALCILGRTLSRPARHLWWFLGLTAGALALARENALLLIPVLLLWLFSHHRDVGGKRFTLAASFLLGCAMVLLPVAVRNLVIGGEFHLTTSQFGPNFFIGNNETADGRYVPLKPERGSPKFERIDAIDLAEQAAGRKLSAGEVSRYWTRRALSFISVHPGSWLVLMVKKLALALNASEILDAEDIYTYSERSVVLRLTGFFHFGVLAPLAVFGIWVTWPGHTRTWFLHALLAAYLASLVLFYVLGRYRYPLVPMMILLAAAGLVQARRAFQALPSRSVAIGVLLAALAAVLCNLQIIDKNNMRASSHYNIGAALYTKGDRDGAMREYLTALDLKPDNFDAHNSLGHIYEVRGEMALAREHFETALRLAPEHIGPMFNLGIGYLREGDLQRAAIYFEKILRLNPGDTQARGFLAYIQRKAGGSSLPAQ